MTPTISAAGWLIEARQVPSPNCNQRPPCAVDMLVVHNISLPPGQFGGGYIEAFFSNQLDASLHDYFLEIQNLQVSAHCLIDREGALTQFVSFNDRAWHAGRSHFAGRDNCNDFSIGVELEGTDELPYSEAQYRTLVRLSLTLIQHYPNITPERIVGHSDIAPGRKTDPGPAFDWAHFHNLLARSTPQEN